MERTELADGQHESLATELAGARVFSGSGDLLEPIEELEFQNNWQLKGETKCATSVLEFGATGGMMETEVADADKAGGQDMGEEATDKLMGVEGHELLFALVAVVAVFEGDGVFADAHNAVIGDGNAEDVATEILDQFLWTIKGGLNVDFPILG